MLQPEWSAMKDVELDPPWAVVCTPPGSGAPETIASCFSCHCWTAEDVARLMALAPRLKAALERIVGEILSSDMRAPRSGTVELADALLAECPVIPEPVAVPSPAADAGAKKTLKKRGAKLPTVEGE